MKKVHTIYLYDRAWRNEGHAHPDGSLMFRSAFEIPDYAWKPVAGLYRRLRQLGLTRFDAHYAITNVLQAGVAGADVDRQPARSVVAS